MSARTPFIYFAVAGICIVLHNGLLIAGDAMGLPLWASVLASFLLVVTVGYVLHGLFTYSQPLTVASFARYGIAMSANIPLAFVIIWLWKNIGGLSMIYAAPIASACMLAINFLLGAWAMIPGKRRGISR